MSLAPRKPVAFRRCARPSSTLAIRRLAALAITAACCGPAFGANYWWRGDVSGVWNVNGGNTNWSSVSSGATDPLMIPGSADTVFFAATTNANLATTLSSPLTIASLQTVSGFAQNYSVGGSTLTLATGQIFHQGTAAANINAPLLTSGATPYNFTNSSTANLTIGSALTGTRALTVAGTGQTVLSAASSYTGGTDIVAGNLATGVANAIPIGTALTIGQLASPSAGRLTTLGLAQSISSLTIYAQPPASTIIDLGTGTLTLTGGISLLNTVSGAGNQYGATILASTGGTLDLGGAVRNITLAGQNLSQNELIVNAVIANGGINLTANPTVFNGAAAGMVLAASTPNTYSGGATVNAGVLTVNASTTLGGPTVALTLNTTGTVPSTVAINSSQTIGSLATGSLGSGAATLMLNGAINLTINQPINTTYAGSITGAGTLTKSGIGTLTLSGANAYAGGTAINGGAITAASSTAIPAATALTIGQLATASGGRLNTGGFPTSISSLTIYGQPSGSTIIDVGAGTLTLNGDISLLDTTSFAGNQYGATIAASAGGTLDLGGGVRNITLAGQNLSQNELVVNAVIANGGIALYANPSVFNAAPAGMVLNAAAPNTYAGGTFVNAGFLTVNPTTTLGAPTSPLTLNTTGAVPSTVVINGNQAIGNLSTGTLGTGLATVQLNAGSSLTVTPTGNAFYSGVITGPGALTKSGSGNLILFDSNTYTGPTTIAQGALQFGLGGPLGTLPSGNFIVNGQLNFLINNPANLVLSNAFSGSGSVLFGGADNVTDHGLFQLVGTNGAFAGTFQLGVSGVDGRLIVTAPQNLGAAFVNVSDGSGLFLNGGTYPNGMTLRGTGFNETAGFLGALHLQTATTTGIINLAANARITATGAGASTISGPITGNSALEVTGSATLILAGSNGQASTTLNSSATLQVNNPNSLPAGKNLTILGGTVDLRAPVTVGNLVFGDGTSTASPRTVVSVLATPATLTVNADIDFNGPGAPAIVAVPLYLPAGTHQAISTGFSSENFYDVILSGPISGPGGLSASGPEYLALNATNSYSGPTNIIDVSAFLGVANALPATTALTVGAGAFLELAPFVNESGVTSGNYSQTIGSLSGAGLIDLGSATLTVGDSTATTFSGQISGSGQLVKRGSGTLILTGTNPYTGGTTITAGTLQLGNGGTTGSILRNVVNNGALAFNRSDSFTFPGLITGTGAITKQGGGTLTLAAGNTSAFSASTLTVSGGAIDLTDNDFILTGMTEAAVRSLITSGALGSSLVTFGSHTALAVITNSDGKGGALYPTFDGTAAASTAVLVKYTYQGDTDLNGYVDGRDLANLLAGLSGHLTGWVNGDINYDGVINAADLNLLLGGLRNQGAPLGDSGGPGGDVPEPSPTAFGLIAAAPLIRRRSPRKVLMA